MMSLEHKTRWIGSAERAPVAKGEPRARAKHPIALAPGKMLAGRFWLDRPIGEGGMGVVWAATHAVTRQRVAIKLLKAHADECARVRFEREARALALLTHPNVMPVLDAFELEDGRPLIVMPLFEGETLRSRFGREGAMPLAVVARIFVQIASAAASAHDLGILHRDLKPENILVAAAGGHEVVRVLDFGIARLTAAAGVAAESLRITRAGAVIGSLRYMSPEQSLGRDDVDHRADVWAIGVMMYEALTGRRAIEARGLAEVQRALLERIAPIEQRVGGLPEPVCRLLNRMVMRDRRERLADLRQVVAVLAPYVAAGLGQFRAPTPADALGTDPPCSGCAQPCPASEITQPWPPVFRRYSDTSPERCVPSSLSTLRGYPSRTALTPIRIASIS